MSGRDLQVNEQVIVELPSPGQPEEEGMGFHACVREVHSRHIVVEPYYDPSRHLTLRREQKVWIKFWDRDGIHYGHSQVVRGQDGALVLVRPRRFQVLQRRQYFRMWLELPFTFSVVDSLEAPATAPTYEATTEDISGGGLRFSSLLQLNPGDSLRIRLDLAPARAITCLATVVRAHAVPGSRKRDVAVHFRDLEERDRSELLRFLFQCQVQNRKRTLAVGP